jgi:glutamate-1-semialdehyde 2,1-aminomutase
MLTLFFGPTEVRSYADAVRSDTERFAQYFRGMLAEGIYLPPSQFEALFVSLAHGDDHVEQLATAAERVLRRI